MVSRNERDAAVSALADRYSLAMPRLPIGGVIGQMLGNSTGSSLEFQDHRSYSPGDDPRHIDWAAFARSDQLTVRLYREEVSPRLEVLADASASMDTGDKGERLRSLLLLLVRLAEKGQAQPTLWLLGDEVRREHHDLSLSIEGLRPGGRTTVPEHLGGGRLGLRPRSIRVLVSDFLYPHDPDALVRRLADGAAALTLVQLLTRREADPPVGPPARLIDVETGQLLDVTQDAATVGRYRDRLRQLVSGLSRAARRVHGALISATDADDLATLCRERLVPGGLLEVK